MEYPRPVRHCRGAPLEGATPTRATARASRDARALWAWAAVLAAATAFCFSPVLGNGFVAYDDDVYVTLNPMVREGFTLRGLSWAFTSGHAANWHPMTWISHMLDAQLFGLDPRGHHLSSLLLHATSVVVLLGLLHRLTGALLRSAAAAALFALHPTRVESVAWVAERKDVLSGLLLLLTTAAYVAWVRRGGRTRYATAVGLFALGIMAKPMLVTLPLLLLLLDFWPLRRFGSPVGWRRVGDLVREKLPFLALAVAAGLVTLAAQRAGGAVATLEEYPLGTRLANAPVAVVQYLGQLVWPTRLAVFYPHPGPSIPPGHVAGALFLLTSLSAAAAAAWRKRPWALVGWLWFLVGLAPVIGVVQVGWQARADRYTYTPFMGLFVLLVWAGAETAERFRHGRVLALVAAAGTLVGCGVLTHLQAATWRSTEALFHHALSVTRENPVAHQALARVLIDQGRAQEAIPHLVEALRVRPGFVDALASLGQVRAMQGQWDEAAAAFAEAARLRPADASTLNNLALARTRQGDFAAAESAYRRAAAAAPRWAEPEHALGVLLLLRGAEAEALERLRRATSLSPDRADLRDHWEGALAMRAAPDSPAALRLACHLARLRVRASLTVWGRGDAPAAVTMLRTTIGQEPRCVEPHLQLGIFLASLGRPSEARASLEQALTLAPDSPEAHRALRELSLTESVRARP